MAKDRLVYCKLCGEQIAKSAKKCPKCGARQRKSHGFRNFILLLFAAGLAFYAYSQGWFKAAVDKYNEGKNRTTISTEKEPKKGKETQAPKREETPTPAAKPTDTPIPSIEAEKQTEELTSESNNQDTAASGVSPDFKAFMDSYESFMNEYCDFMESYDDSDAAAVIRFASLMTKYSEFASKVDSYNEENLSAEDYKYYIDVMTRVEKRMIDISE